jgi:hypothetical protein
MNRILDHGKNYSQFKNLPPLAGVGEFPDAITKGLAIDNCVTRLKRYHYALKRLHGIFNDHITSEPIYELKMVFSLHSYYCAEHVAALRTRVGEMREPPLGLDKVPDDNLRLLFDEIIAQRNVASRIRGIYQVALPAIIRGMERHLDETNPLADHPSVRVCRFALLELRDMHDYGQKAIACLPEDEPDGTVEWIELLKNAMLLAGDLDGTQEVPEDIAVAPLLSADGYQYDPDVKRDGRFYDPFNMGVNAEIFLHNEEFDPASKVLMMYYKRLREIDVPEMMAGIIAQTPDQPWEYYRQMTRQLWDEARHAMMGEVGFVSLGLDWSEIPINFTWSRALNLQLTPIERHAVLYFIEQGLMPKSGKRHEWEVAVASQNPLAAIFQDYDWADEVLHAQIGRNWFVSQFDSAKKATDYGDECWTRALLDWGAWREEGLTEHRNWWPELYRAACEKAGIEPRADILAYEETYEGKRADLKVTVPAESVRIGKKQTPSNP